MSIGDCTLGLLPLGIRKGAAGPGRDVQGFKPFRVLLNNWETLAAEFGPLHCAGNGRPAIPIRLMARAFQKQGDHAKAKQYSAPARFSGP